MAASPPDGPRDLRDFRVRIAYQEPTYRSPTGPRPDPYVWTFTVRARSKKAALALATDEFRDMERQSSVGWVRVIVSTTVEELTG